MGEQNEVGILPLVIECVILIGLLVLFILALKRYLKRRNDRQHSSLDNDDIEMARNDKSSRKRQRVLTPPGTPPIFDVSSGDFQPTFSTPPSTPLPSIEQANPSNTGNLIKYKSDEQRDCLGHIIGQFVGTKEANSETIHYIPLNTFLSLNPNYKIGNNHSLEIPNENHNQALVEPLKSECDVEESDLSGDDDDVSLFVRAEAPRHVLFCHVVYVICCAVTKQILLVGKSNNGIYAQIREKRHCYEALKGKELAGNKWRPAYDAIQKALNTTGIIIFRPFMDLREDEAFYREACLIHVNDGFNKMPGTLKERFLGQEEFLQTDGEWLLQKVQDMLSSNNYPVYKAANYNEYTIVRVKQMCKKCKGLRAVRGNGVCLGCEPRTRKRIGRICNIVENNTRCTNEAKPERLICSMHECRKIRNKEYRDRVITVDYCPLSSLWSNSCPSCSGNFFGKRLRIKFKISGVMGGWFYHAKCLAEKNVIDKPAETFNGFDVLTDYDKAIMRDLFPTITTATDDEN